VIVSRIAGDKYSQGFLASFFLHIPVGVTYIRALKAAEGLTRGDFTKSAAYTVAFAVIGVAGPNVAGKNKNTPYCGPRNRRDRTMLNQPDARARCGEGAGSAMRSVTPAANVSLSPALGLRDPDHDE
jgi:hypothetical protein